RARRFVLDGRRRIRRQPIRHVRRAVRVLVARPAAFVGNDEALEPVELLDLPDAVLLHVLVLVRPLAEESLLAEPAEKKESPPACFRRAAVLRDRHDGLELQVLVELARVEAGLAVAERVKVLADAFLADVHTVEPDLDRAVLREE